MTVAGTKVYLHHTKNADQDKIYIPGPTTEPLTIVVSYFILHALIRSKIGIMMAMGPFSSASQCKAFHMKITFIRM